MPRHRRRLSAASAHPVHAAAIVTTTTVEDSRATSGHVSGNPTAASADPPPAPLPLTRPHPPACPPASVSKLPAPARPSTGLVRAAAPGEIRRSTLCGQTSPIAGEARP